MEDFHESGRNQIGLDLFQSEETSVEAFHESRLEMNLVGLELLHCSNTLPSILLLPANIPHSWKIRRKDLWKTCMNPGRYDLAFI